MLLSDALAWLDTVLQEVECFVGSVGFLVESFSCRFCPVVVIDRSQVNVRVLFFKLFHFPVKSVLLKLATQLAESLLVLGHVGVVFDE